MVWSITKLHYFWVLKIIYKVWSMEIQGVSKKSTDFCFAYFSASKTPQKVVPYIFQQPNLCRIQKWQYHYSRVKIRKSYWQKSSENTKFEMICIEVSTILMRIFVFRFSQLPRHLKKGFVQLLTPQLVHN